MTLSLITRSLCAFLLTTASLGCHAQAPSATLSPELARRVEILIRTRSKIPPDYILSIGPREKSEIPGFDFIEVTVAQQGETSKPIKFLLSTDGKTLAQFNKFDISKDPKLIVNGEGRPSRGGPANAPVEIVVFDDLECPFCARMHAQLFPALIDRYGGKVRIVYRDLPISQHPWAMHAAVDANCVAAQSVPGYWNIVDYVHAHAADFGGEEKSLKKAEDSLDQLAYDQGKNLKLNHETLEACVKKQDETAMKASLKLGEDLNVEATPVLFINGERLEGAYPLVDVFRMVDSALAAEGVTPPPPYKPAPEPAPAAKSSN